jgi:hypothetical protein
MRKKCTLILACLPLISIAQAAQPGNVKAGVTYNAGLNRRAKSSLKSFDTSAITIYLSGVDVPGNANFIVPLSSGLRDWRKTQNDHIWQENSNINNPCPKVGGYQQKKNLMWKVLHI